MQASTDTTMNNTLPALGHAAPGHPPAAADVPAAPLRLLSTDLLRGASEVLIEHQTAQDTQVYRLRRTTLGKLILTK